ncbi:MAG: heavy metal sensor histidine kinase [Nitrospinae bacterium]|nr:heavy metal sensor histidine kinase [Nitrospinota bacterium]
MSSKSVENPSGDRAPLASSWFWSITGRLTFLYTLAAFGMLVVATVFLYWVLLSNLEGENEQFLADQIHVLRVILWERPDDLVALEMEIKREGASRQFTKYYARVLDEGGHTLIERPGMGDILPASLFPDDPMDLDELSGAGDQWKSRDGRSYILMAAWAEAGRSGGKRQIQVALDVSHQEALIADYQGKLAIVLVLGILFSAGAGVAVARRGMRPLAEITQAAQRITATQLHERIGPARWPKELTALATAFDEMLNRLEDSFTRLSQFSSDLAHELRTPINNLMGEAEVALSRARTPDEYRQVLESSLEEYVRLSRMIDNLLFLARAESPETRIERSQFDALKEISAVLEFYEAVAEEQGIEVTCHGNGSLHADIILFRRALSNLLSNAFRYTPCGGKIRIFIEPSDGQSVKVKVNDTGSGIDPGHLPRIFDRFYRTDHARSQYPQGTGLGLAIVRSIMDLHGGTVTVQSERGKGTGVTLDFPRRAEPSLQDDGTVIFL